MILLTVLSGLLVSLHVGAYTRLSPIDELQHIDYLFKSPHVVGTGELFGQDAMREEACRGIDSPFVPPACSAGAVYIPGQFQESGYNTASIYSPLYYSITHGLGNLVLRITGNTSLVTAARRLGALWLAAGLLIAYAAGRRLRVPRPPLTAALLLLAITPPILAFSSTVTPDAATMSVGASVIWALVFWEERPTRRWPLLILVTLFALFIKQTNMMIIAAACVYIALRCIRSIRAPNAAKAVADQFRSPGQVLARPRDYLIGAGVVAVSGIGQLLIWQAISSRAAVAAADTVPMNRAFQVSSFPVDGFWASFGRYLNPLGQLGPLAGDATMATLVLRLAWVLLIPGMLAVAIFRPARARVRQLAQSCAVLAVVGAPMFVAVAYLLQGQYIGSPDRYAFSLLPAIALGLAAAARTLTARAVLASGVMIGVVLTVVRLLLA